MTEDWAQARTALDRAAAEGRSIRIWLRDDDATAVTSALERLADLCDRYAMPILLAAIPARAERALAAWVADRPAVMPCQHGFAHANHAAAGQRACEIGGERPLETVLDELRRGRARLQTLFGTRLGDILVSPWNRIDDAVVPHLPGLGFSALSTFGASPPVPKAGAGNHAPLDGGGGHRAPTLGSGPVAIPPHEPSPYDSPLHRVPRSPSPALRAGEDLALPRLDCDLDIIDWRGGRVGRHAADVAERLATLIDRDVSAPVGLLTHHLAHDETAWAVLDEMLALLASHPAVELTSADALLQLAHV